MFSFYIYECTALSVGKIERRIFCYSCVYHLIEEKELPFSIEVKLKRIQDGRKAVLMNTIYDSPIQDKQS